MIAVDQSKSMFVPRFRPNPSDITRRHRLEICVGGGINFSFGYKKYLFLSLKQYPGAADLVLTQLFEIIFASITSNTGACRSRVLHIHADNTAKENKNQWMLAFCGWLLLLGWFDRIRVSFLIAGHTYNEIDSVIFAALHKQANFQGSVTIFDVLMKFWPHLPKDTTPVWIESIYDW